MIDSREWVYIQSNNDNQSTKLEYNDEGGSIIFDGYWYTAGFRQQLEKRDTGENFLPFTETFEAIGKLTP
jgi:hypothetical protein